jgi:hypothetical protein
MTRPDCAGASPKDKYSSEEIGMTKRLGVIVLVITAMAGIAAVGPHAVGVQAGSNLTVHEWGTFTSIAGTDGQAVPWRPLSGPSDLPCFVTTLNPNSIKVDSKDGIPGIKALVRMETPVLYFYSPSAMTARVSVAFPQGLFSEWYPQSSVGMVRVANTSRWQWQIRWSKVEISPGASEVFPTEPGESHYYAARDTGAVPVRVGDQQEKFLFYRGVATFAPPIMATVAGDGSIAVSQKTNHPVDTLVLFERRGGDFGYRMVSADRTDLRIERPVLNGSLASLKEDLRGILIKRGLYPREAAAMVETWRDSWFEEGTRVFCLVPQATVDRILPLDIDPKPANITRVFVGRIEVVTPEIESEVAAAIRAKDQVTLRKYGRFLEPISEIVRARLATTHDEEKIGESLMALAAKPTTMCKAATPAPSTTNHSVQ